MTKKKAATTGAADEKDPKNTDPNNPENTDGNPGEGEEQKPVNPREAQMEEIIKRQRAERIGEGEEELEEEIDGKGGGQPDDGGKPGGGAPGEEGKKTELTNDDYETVIIDGVETKVEKSKIYDTGKRALAKELYADKKIKEAKEEADRILREARAEAEKQKKGGKVDTDDTDELSLDDEELESIAWAVGYGDDSERKGAIKRLVSAVRGAKATKGEALTKDEVTALFQQEKDKQAFESALEQVKKPQSDGGYGELFDGGVLENALAFEDSRLAKDEPDLNYLDRLKKAGDTIRSKFKIPTNGGSPNNGSRNQQRKANLGNEPTSVTRTHKGGGEAPETESSKHQRHLDEIRKSRGRGF